MLPTHQSQTYRERRKVLSAPKGLKRRTERRHLDSAAGPGSAHASSTLMLERRPPGLRESFVKGDYVISGIASYDASPAGQLDIPEMEMPMLEPGEILGMGLKLALSHRVTEGITTATYDWSRLKWQVLLCLRSLQLSPSSKAVILKQVLDALPSEAQGHLAVGLTFSLREDELRVLHRASLLVLKTAALLAGEDFAPPAIDLIDQHLEDLPALKWQRVGTVWVVGSSFSEDRFRAACLWAKEAKITKSSSNMVIVLCGPSEANTDVQVLTEALLYETQLSGLNTVTTILEDARACRALVPVAESRFDIPKEHMANPKKAWDVFVEELVTLAS